MTDYFKTEEVNDHITLIKTITSENLYYVQGEKLGMLIDTSEGLSPLKPLVDKLAKTPYIVVLTHGHIDHAMGAAEFSKDHLVFMNLSDRLVYDSMVDLKGREDYAKSVIPKEVKWTNLNIKPVNAQYADEKFLDLKDGMIFDLGGVHIKAFHFPGHTPGMTALLFVEDRILLTGDGANRSTFVWTQYSPSVHSYRQIVKELIARVKGQYDRIFISHDEHELNSKLLQNLLSVCDDIISGKADNIPNQFMGSTYYIAKKIAPRTKFWKRADGIDGNIFYNPKNI